MKIFGYSFFEKTEVENQTLTDTKSYLYTDETTASPWIPIRSKTFNGEKNPGELGNPNNLIPDFRTLRFRAYEAKLTSDIVKIIVNKFFKWVVGNGLKLQSEPNSSVLKLEGVKFNHAKFTDNIEAYFSTYSKSKISDFSNMCTLHDNASKAFETAFLGGDVLVILRLDENDNVRVQVIDGQHVVTPFLNGNHIQEAEKRGNTIIHGIEVNNKGEDIAYYIIKQDTKLIFGEVERVLARGEKSGLLMAWMIYGDKHRIDHKRGIPVITPVLEKVTKLDRYTEASVSSAEERAKVPWYIKHSRFSDGENPLVASIKRNTGGTINEDPYKLGDALSKNISVTENKTVYNLPIGAEFSGLDSQTELQYEPFFKAVFVQICAAVDIPPEVALQQYNSNYSASRAAINGWGFIIDIYRQKFANSFYKNVYDLWLYVHVLKNKVDAPGYIQALRDNNQYIIESYNGARFTGAKMPHIDPKKEADAIRIMLGDETTPLISFEQASEQLGNGEWSQNYKKIVEERKLLQPQDKTTVNPDKKLNDKNLEDATDSKTEE